jgi:multiple sugar transport system permease protein
MKRRKVWDPIHWLLTAASKIVFLWPVAFMLIASFKPDEDVLSGAASIRAFLPREMTLENYRSVFEQLDFPHFLFNSVLIVGSIVAGGLAVNSLAGHALSRLKWPGRRIVLASVAAVLVVPYEAVALPMFFEVAVAGWIDCRSVQIIPFVANPFSVYLFATFFSELPRELDESARIDGAGPLRIFPTIVVPLSRPAFAAVAILSFLFHWGLFLWPLMVTSGPEFQPLPVALGYFSAQKPVQWGDIMAFGSLLVAPVLLISLLFQNWFVRGIAQTGLRG